MNISFPSLEYALNKLPPFNRVDGDYFTIEIHPEISFSSSEMPKKMVLFERFDFKKVKDTWHLVEHREATAL